MPQFAQDILFVTVVALLFVAMLRWTARRLDRRRPSCDSGAGPGPAPGTTDA